MTLKSNQFKKIKSFLSGRELIFSFVYTNKNIMKSQIWKNPRCHLVLPSTQFRNPLDLYQVIIKPLTEVHKAASLFKKNLLTFYLCYNQMGFDACICLCNHHSKQNIKHYLLIFQTDVIIRLFLMSKGNLSVWNFFMLVLFLSYGELTSSLISLFLAVLQIFEN